MHFLSAPARRTAVGLTLLLAALTVPAPAQNHARWQLPPGATPADYRPGVLVFRVAAQYKSACSASEVAVPALQRALTLLQASGLERIFPHSPAPTAAQLEREPRCVDLSLVYRVRYAAPLDIQRAVNTLRATGAVAYAEPDYLGRTRFTPNDPQAAQQSHLAQIHALEAWDTQQGDTTVLIGIVDTGVDLDHPDLAAQIQRNYADPPNGVDDDNDGYVDNYRGWDMAGGLLSQPSQDNFAGDVGTGATYHGTHVAGLAAARTNNGVGVAGVGFKCRILPIKCGPDDNGGYIINGYPGIVYAADHGCAVINCSWGAIGFPDIGQDAIDYATFNRNALVLTAAGNNGWPDPFTPAGFRNVLTVGSVDAADVKSGFSNYGVYTHVFAPGSGVRSTLWNDAYGLNSGTSMACPVTSGAAALVKAQHPTYTGEQVGQLLRMTCDNIDALNPTLAGYLGRGRINVLRALQENPSSVRLEERRFTDTTAAARTAALYAGTAARLRGTFRSFLKPTAGLIATLTSTSSAVTITRSVVSVGNLATGQTLTLTPATAFEVQIAANAPVNELVRFTITYADQNGYQDFEKFEVFLNPSWRDLTVNQLHTSITSKGRIGYNDNRWAQGLGLVYKNHDNLLFEMGLLVASDSTHVSNTVTRFGSYPPQADDHLRPVGGSVRPVANPVADAELAGQLSDIGANPRQLPVYIRYHAYAWASPPKDQFIILSYSIRNVGTTLLPNVYAGLFADWDIGNALGNRAAWDSTRALGYAYSTESDSAYAGIRYLGPGPASQATYRAIDYNSALPGNPWGLTDGFTKVEKWQALSQGVSRRTAGLGGGSDICTMSGAGPFSIAPGDSAVVMFAIVAGDDLGDLQTAADAAANAFSPVTGLPPVSPAAIRAPYPNPTTGTLTLPTTGRPGRADVYNLHGTRVLTQPVLATTPTQLTLTATTPGLYTVRFVPTDGTPGANWRVVISR